MAKGKDITLDGLYDFSDVPEVKVKEKSKYEQIRDGLEHIKNAIAGGKSKKGLAQHFEVSYSTFIQYVRRAEKEAANSAAKQRRRERDLQVLNGNKSTLQSKAQRMSLNAIAREYGVQLKTLREFMESEGKSAVSPVWDEDDDDDLLDMTIPVRTAVVEGEIVNA
jgi:transposase